MKDFVALQQAMKERLERDRGIKAVDAEGATLEDAVASAATLLDLPVRKIEYEITSRGFSGFLGTGAKNWKIKAYQRVAEKSVEEAEEALAELEEAAVKVVAEKDGDAFVQFRNDGAFLKVVAPVGKGRRISEEAVAQLVAGRGVQGWDEAAVAQIAREASGTYMKIGDFPRMPTNDSMMSVNITADEMKAYITVSPPGEGGCDISCEEALAYLRSNKIMYGVNEEALTAFTDRPAYKEPFLAAEGLRPEDGRDGYLKYNFETDQSKVKLREGVGGRVDFKDLNIIQNVVEGQPLAVIVPAEEGTTGRTVTGKVLPAKNGKELPTPQGKNIHISDDGTTVLADKNGQVLLTGGKINVEEVYTVNGNVDLKTGNIIFLGNVSVTGNVEAGFSVKAAGNIEVHGTIEKAELDAEGDIIVNQGINGGTISAGKSVWARFIENAQVDAGAMVVVSENITNSQVDAFKRIVCNGKKARILGGRLRATEEINAKTLGSGTSGVETICEVGFDPKSKAKLEELGIAKASMDKQAEEIQLNIKTLIGIKKQRKTLPEDKEAYLQELMDKRQQMATDLAKNKEETDKINAFLAGLKTRGRVSASSKVYPGVVILIRDAKEDVRNEYRAVTFILENGLVRVTKYEEPDEEAKKGPDGYITN